MRCYILNCIFLFLVFSKSSAYDFDEDCGFKDEPEEFCQQFIKDEKCVWKGQQSINISKKNPCIFSCTYDPSQVHPGPIRLNVHMRSDIFANNVFITARQNHLVSSWKLPIFFPEHGRNQPFSTIEEIMCPTMKETKDQLYFRIETESENVVLNVSLTNVHFIIQLNETVTITSTPVSPWVKLYNWMEHQDSALVTVENKGKNGKSVCSLLSLQNARCPVQTDKMGIIGAGLGRYQTFQERGGMVAKKSLFPDGVYIVILPLPDDALCTGFEENFNNKTSRSKSTSLVVIPHKMFGQVYGIFLVAAVAIFGFVGTSTFAIIQFGIKRNVDALNIGITDEDEPLLLGNDDSASEGEPVRRTLTTGGLIFSNPNGLPSQVETNDQMFIPNIDELGDLNVGMNPDGFVSGGHRIIRNHMLAIRGNPAATSENVDNALSVSQAESNIPHLLSPTREYNPRCVYWWKISAEYSNVYGNSASETGFHKNLITVAVFMALPLSEILRSYLHVFHYHGSEDQCYFNSRCIISCGIFPDFARVFTNLGYLICGVCFAIILKAHKSHNWVVSKGEILGVSRNYGLFLALAVGLVIQFFMSGLYHVCPNIVTLRFDMMFMYVMAIVLVIGVWGLRHDSVAPHVYPTVGMVGLALLVAELKDWVNDFCFWSIAIVIQTFFTLTISIMMYKTSTWSFSPMEMLKIWKKWKPLLSKMKEEIFTEETSLRPWTLFRIIMGISTNITLMVIGAWTDMEVYFYILIVCLVNMGLYVTNYIFTKKLNKERGTNVSWMCLTISFLFWILGFVYFFGNSTNTEASASASRAMNSDCIMFGVFDSHDIWHMASAFALFFSFVGILTLDDDLASTSPENFASF